MKTTRTKLLGTFITVVWIRVISFAIFAFFSSDTNPSSVITVYNGIGAYPPNEKPHTLRLSVRNRDQFLVYKLFNAQAGIPRTSYRDELCKNHASRFSSESVCNRFEIEWQQAQKQDGSIRPQSK